jgi:CRISPR-associated protein Csd1
MMPLQYSDATSSNAQGSEAVCLVTGEPEDFERLHPAIKGVYGSQTAGANIVSFNLDAFKSFGKAQGANAPIGKKSVFAYTTALNYWLSRDSKQRIQVGLPSSNSFFALVHMLYYFYTCP